MRFCIGVKVLEGREMDSVEKAYTEIGKTSLYDGMITCSTFFGKAVCRIVWNMNKET